MRVRNETATALYLSDIRLSVAPGETVRIHPGQANSKDLQRMLKAKFLRQVGSHVVAKATETLRGWMPQAWVAREKSQDAVAEELSLLRDQLSQLTDLMKQGVPVAQAGTGPTPAVSPVMEPETPMFIPEVQIVSEQDVKPDVQTSSGSGVASAVERLRAARRKDHEDGKEI